MLSQVVVLLFCTALAYAYVVPEPTITVSCPQGLKLSIPDDRDIKSVQFYLSFDKTIPNENPGQVNKERDDQTGASNWIYFNPSLALNVGDSIRYKIAVVDTSGANCWLEGTKIISRSLLESDDCDSEGQRHIPPPRFPNSGSDDYETSNLAKTGSIKNNLKPSYSMFKTYDSQPITRSQTTTTSGSFYVKPSGAVESSGFRTASSFDSTRRDGEQWQHSKSALSASEIEELKRIHGQDFLSQPAFAHLYEEHQGLQGSQGLSGLHGVHGTTGTSGSSHYRYSSSSSTSSQTKPVITSSLTQTGQMSSAIPLMRPSGSYSASEYESTRTSNSAPFPSSTNDDTVYIRTPVRKPVLISDLPVYSSTQDDYQKLTPISSNPSYISKYEKSEVVRTSSSNPTPVIAPKPSGFSTSKQTTLEYTSAPKTIIAQPLNFDQTLYSGEIFRSSVRPSTPQSCTVADYSRLQPDVITIDRQVQEMQCLAVLAEYNVKAEIRALKEANSNLVQRLQELEEKFRRYLSDSQVSYE